MSNQQLGPGWMTRMLSEAPAERVHQPAVTDDEKKQLAKRLASQDNANRLLDCQGPHVFVREAIATDDGQIQASGLIRCTTCGGVVTENQARWYKRGQTHGRGEPLMRQKPSATMMFEEYEDNKRRIL